LTAVWPHSKAESNHVAIQLDAAGGSIAYCSIGRTPGVQNTLPDGLFFLNP
jgi:hypothetical protein